MPVRPNHPTSDPQQRPQKKSSVVGVVIFSVAMVLLMMFTVGKLPAGDALLASLNTTLQQRNDQIVAAIVEYSPYVLIGSGLLGMLFLLFNRAPRKTAR